jgi:hypothetical protein
MVQKLGVRPTIAELFTAATLDDFHPKEVYPQSALWDGYAVKEILARYG